MKANIPSRRTTARSGLTGFPAALLAAALAAVWLFAQTPAAAAQANGGAPCGDFLEVPCGPAPTAGAPPQTGSGTQNQLQNQLQTQLQNSGSPAGERMQNAGVTGDRVYIDAAGNQNTRPPDTDLRARLFPPDPVTDLQRLARTSLGELLPVFGRNFFEQVPSTFAPGDQLPVTPDYVIGPGDDVLLRLSGPETFNSQLTVDRSGSIYVPKVGSIHVAGLRFDELQGHISAEFAHTYRNFRLSVNLGRLRSIQVYVVGEARRPGAYTISSLSTVLNALFASGGPDVQGSLRQIQVRRAGQTLATFDLYDLVLRGDRTQEIPLQSGDTIFIPPVGPQVALGGSVRHPAVYELKDRSTLSDVLALAGGFSATAAPAEVTVDRIDPDLSRRVMNVALDDAGKALALKDGDVLYAGHISAAFSQTVTIRGNLANPGRFAWHQGMRLADIIPDQRSLLTTDYWRERNRLGLPTPLFQPLGPAQGYANPGNGAYPNRTFPEDRGSGQSPAASSNGQGQGAPYGVLTDPASGQGFPAAETGAFLAAVPGGDGQNSQYQNGQYPNGQVQNGQLQNGPLQNGQYPNGPTQSANGAAGVGTLAQVQGSDPYRTSQVGNQPGARTTIRIPAPEIDWSYAVIERLDPVTLKSSLVPFHLGRLVQGHDASQNLVLEPGDVVTILSQNDVLVPLDEQTKYVRLEGEFAGAGVYSVSPDETLNELVMRAGGLTAKAYLYGSSFQRESARAFQQQRLDEYISTLSTDMEREAAVRTASSSNGVLDPNALAEQRSLIAQLRQLRATGRIVLEFQPDSTGVATIPAIPLENGDVFRIPSRPNTVSVIGAVYGQNVFLYIRERRLEDYVSLAGDPNRIADPKHAFIIRADGSVFSRERAQGVLSNHFNDARINPGDSIVIPEKLIKPSALRNLIDYSQILSSFGLAAAAINVVR